MKRSLMILSCALLAGCLLTGCASRNDATNPIAPMQTADTRPEGTDNMMPDTTNEPVIPGNASGLGVTTVDAAQRAAKQIRMELERLSEVDDAQVMVAGNMAAVALKLDSQYRAGVDQRLRDMVEERIKDVVSGVDRVFVSEETEHFELLNNLGERLDNAADLHDIQAELTRFFATVNPLA